MYQLIETNTPMRSMGQVELQKFRYSRITARAFRINIRSELVMAVWVLICKRCGETFAYCEIGESLLDYLFPKKPEMSVEGVECECPTCKAKFVYLQYELVFRK
jgi:hypothetical protein